MSYGVNWPDLFRRTAELVDRILRGTKPGDIPVEQPTKFDLVVNLTTTKARWCLFFGTGHCSTTFTSLRRGPCSPPCKRGQPMPCHEREN